MGNQYMETGQAEQSYTYTRTEVGKTNVETADLYDIRR